MALKTYFLALASTFAAFAADSPYVIASPEFKSILGPSPNLTVVINQSLPLFHEACIYHPPSDSLFVVSDHFQDPSINNNQSGQYIIHISNLYLSDLEYEILYDIPLANPLSGARYLHSGEDIIVITALGNLENDPPGE